MTRTLAVISTALALSPFAEPSTARAKEPTPVEFRKLADRVVREGAALREGDLVTVWGPSRHLALLEELSLAVHRMGGQAMVLPWTPRTVRRYYSEVPEKYDAAAGTWLLKRAEILNVVIRIDSLEDPGLLDDVPASRLATVAQGEREALALREKRGVRTCAIGNGLLPTEAQAKELGISRAELASAFWGALATDAATLRARGDAIQRAVAAGKDLRLTHPNGTDLRMGVEGRTVLISDGAMTPEKERKGGGALTTFLPAGEAMLGPVPGTAEGKLVFDRVPYGKGRIEKLTFTIKSGKLVSHAAKPGAAYELWKKRYEAAPAGKDQFSGLDIGINTGLKQPGGKPLETWIAAGMVNAAIGDDTWVGGTNQVAYGAGGFIPGATVTVDGKPIVEKGKLVAR